MTISIRGIWVSEPAWKLEFRLEATITDDEARRFTKKSEFASFLLRFSLNEQNKC